MAPEFLGKLSGLLLGAGYGILAIVCLAATIMFGRFCYLVNDSIETKYSYKNPQNYNLDKYQTALTITIFACITFAVSFAAIALSGILGGQKIVLILLAGVVAVCGIVTLITEGLFYNFALLSYKNTKPNGNSYRNVSSAQDYIKDSLEAIYKQAYSAFEAISDKDAELKANMPKNWDDTKKLIGKDIKSEDGASCALVSKCYFTYYDLEYRGINLFSKVITFGIGNSYQDFGMALPSTVGSRSFVIAYYDGYQIPVASLNFKDSEKFTQTYKHKACWPEDSNKDSYKCKTIKYELKEQVSEGVTFESSPFTLNQYIVPDDAYFSNIQKSNDKITVNYWVQDIPIAYKLMDYKTFQSELEKYKDGDENAFFFEEDDDHYKVSGKTFAKAKRSEEKVVEYAYDDSDFFMCETEPSDENSLENCEERTPCGLAADLPNAFAFTNVGKYPDFCNDQLVSQRRTNILNYREHYQFSFSAMIITIFGVLFVIAGLVPSLLGGSD